MLWTDILAFSAEQVCRLTGLSLRQLRYWDHTEFFSPEQGSEYGYGAFTRIYSFRDVVGLYTIATLRKKFTFSLQKLRSVGRYLHKHHDTPWSGLALFVAGREIIFRDPSDPEAYVSTLRPGQRVLPIEMEKVAHHVEVKARRFQKRRRSQIGKIERQRFIVHNSPVLAGTRIPTSAVWNLHAAKYNVEAILREYPRLTPDDIRAAIAYERKRQRARAG